MELDDALLGLAAAGTFPSVPLAVGFLVNAAHCAEKRAEGGMQASEMHREKRAFLDAFFGGRFFTVLDRFASGGSSRGWAGSLGAEDLAALGEACGLEDELAAWLEAALAPRPAVLHLLLSGPLLGRGEELCAALSERLLAQGPEGQGPQLVIWAYAGSFNLVHSSEGDRASLGKLAEAWPARVAVVETTLKAGAWLCEPPVPFWGRACPTAWTRAEAEANPVGYDASTDIQSVNMFLEGYSSRAPGAPARGLRWIFQRVAEAEAGQGEKASGAPSVSNLLEELEVRSLATNLTKMVPPDSSSMSELRKALALQDDELSAAYQAAVSRLEEFRAAPEGAGDADSLSAAARRYAEMYRGPGGSFLQAGCTECFPPGKPCGGPRLDKRCILRCMAAGTLQGGPTADLLVALALLLFLEELDAGSTRGPVEQAAGPPVCCDLLCTSRGSSRGPAETGAQEAPAAGPLPPATRELFELRPGRPGAPRVFAAVLRPKEMSAATKAELAPLVDAALDAAARGGVRLRRAVAEAGPAALWGPLHRAA